MRIAHVALLAVAACGGASSQPPTAVIAPPALTAPPIQIDPSSIPAPNAPSPFEMAMNDSEVCVRLDGVVRCGRGFDPDKSFIEVKPKPGDDATSIALGRSFGCLTRARGQVECWGLNQHGQLGAGSRVDQSEAPLPVVGITNAKRVIASVDHACAILTDGGVRCWGNNRFGQTGSDTYYTEAAHELVEPTPVAGVSNVDNLAASGTTTCAIARGGPVTCWGMDPLTSDRSAVHGSAPKRVEALAGLDDISGAGTAFCGIKDAAPLCWGESYSLLPDFRGRTDKPLPVKVPGRAKKVRVGESHACALMDDGRVLCWGSNWSGALGRPTLGETWATNGPGVVEGLPRATEIYAGGGMACALTDGRALFCWGRWALESGERKEPSPVAMRID